MSFSLFTVEQCIYRLARRDKLIIKIPSMLKKQLSMDFTLLFTGRIFLSCESRMSDFRFNYAPMQHSKPTYQLRFEFILFCLYFFTICIVLIIIISFLCPCRQSEFTITLIMFLMFSHFIP